jgi:hypothetical protein
MADSTFTYWTSDGERHEVPIVYYRLPAGVTLGPRHNWLASHNEGSATARPRLRSRFLVRGRRFGKRKLDPFIPMIDRILGDDKSRPLFDEIFLQLSELYKQPHVIAAE